MYATEPATYFLFNSNIINSVFELRINNGDYSPKLETLVRKENDVIPNQSELGAGLLVRLVCFTHHLQFHLVCKNLVFLTIWSRNGRA